MMYAFLADAVFIGHFAFVMFAALGGLLVLYRRRWAWLHMPAVAWSILVELMDWICPLTPLENEFRIKGGKAPYTGDFIEQYLLPVLYPENLTRTGQVLLGMLLMAVNVIIYAYAIYKHRRRKGPQAPPA